MSVYCFLWVRERELKTFVLCFDSYMLFMVFYNYRLQFKVYADMVFMSL